jgi:hypothetical protein
MSHTSLKFLPAQTRFLHAGTGLLGFFPHRGFLFPQAMAEQNFFLTEVLFFLQATLILQSWGRVT